MDDEGACWLDVRTGQVEAPPHLGGERTLDLDGPTFAFGVVDHQIDFRAGAGAVEVRLCEWGQHAEKGLDDVAFPALAHHRVPGELFQRRDAQQGVYQAAVAHIHLRGLHQPLADVGPQGRQAAHQQQITQEVYVAGDGLGTQLQGSGEGGDVQRRALAVRQHRP